MHEEFNDVDDVYAAISKRLFSNFDEIPQRFQSGWVALEWFKSMATSSPNQSLEQLFCQVPSEFWSMEFLLAASDAGCNILGHIDMGKDNNHASAGLRCMRKNYKHLSALDPKYRGLAAEHMAWNSTHNVHLIAREFPWFRDHLQSSELERCCINIDFVLDSVDLPVDIRRKILLNGDGLDTIRACGRLDVLADQIAIGWWPKRISGFELSTPIPTSLEDAVSWIPLCQPDKVVESLYMSYLMNQPIDQVIPLMCERKMAKLVLEMYSEEALAPYLKKYRALRGVVLEDAMGL
jgi:hypothetical protein